MPAVSAERTISVPKTLSCPGRVSALQRQGKDIISSASASRISTRRKHPRRGHQGNQRGKHGYTLRPVSWSARGGGELPDRTRAIKV